MFANITRPTTSSASIRLGRVLGRIDLRGLLTDSSTADVLNGIAYDQRAIGCSYRQLWPKLFRSRSPSLTRPALPGLPPYCQVQVPRVEVFLERLLELFALFSLVLGSRAFRSLLTSVRSVRQSSSKPR